MKKELKPVDLGHLEDTALAVVDAFNKANDPDRSEEYRKHHLKSAETIANVLLRDFRHYFDTHKIGGIEPYGLSEKDLLT